MAKRDAPDGLVLLHPDPIGGIPMRYEGGKPLWWVLGIMPFIIFTYMLLTFMLWKVFR
jgi:hypothetical protein